MKAGVTLIFLAGIGALATAGYTFYSVQEFSRAVDERVDDEIASAELLVVREHVRDFGAGAPARLNELYNGSMGEELNLRYGRLLANWGREYPQLARIPMIDDGLSESDRLAAEIDERFGPGVSAVFQAHYEQYEREAPQRIAARIAAEEAHRARIEALERYGEEYRRIHGRYPDRLPPGYE